MVSAVSWNMAVDMEGAVVQPRARPTLGTRFSTDLETIRGRFRFVGAGMIISGALWLVTIVADLRLGQAGRVMFMPILVAALLIGGTKLVVQRYSAGLDTVRRSGGIVGLALGTIGIVVGLQGLLAPTQFYTDFAIGGGILNGTDLLTLLSLLSLVGGSGLILNGALSLWSRRYAAWYQRRWDKRERRHNEKLGQRG